MDEGQIRKKYNITGCEHCPYFVEVDIKEGEQRPGQKPGWRQYCGKGNFNINRTSYVVTKTSHNKNKVVPENHYEWEYAFPNRCPIKKRETMIFFICIMLVMSFGLMMLYRRRRLYDCGGRHQLQRRNIEEFKDDPDIVFGIR